MIRPETSADIPSIRSLTNAAFEGVEHSSQTEGAIVDALRNDGALVVSLVAEQDSLVVGHVGFSPVRIDGEDIGWFGLGPVSPSCQRECIGSALIRAGLEVLASRGANGCVVLGEPGYYGRFGFTSDHSLRYSDVPAQYFQSLVLGGEPAGGEVVYSKGFEAS